MLNEIIKEIGYENIVKEIKESISVENSLYVRIPLNGELDVKKDVLLIKKEPEVQQLELLQWFKDREFYSNRIMPNKSIVIGGVYSKLISTANQYSIIFKWNNFITHKNTTKDIYDSFNTLVKEYLNKLNAIDYFVYYVKCFPYIYDYIITNSLDKFELKLFIDISPKEMKQQYFKYLQKSLFDDNTLIKINNEERGRLSQFYTLNSKKPLLSYMLDNIDEIHLLNSEDAEKIFYLKQYMDKKKSETIQKSIGSIEFNMQKQESTNTWYLNEFRFNPLQIKEDIPYIDITNVMDGKFFKEKHIDKYNQLSEYIMQLLEYKVKKYYSKNDNIESKFKTFSLMYYKYIQDINNTNIDLFKVVYPNMIKNIYSLYRYGESINKIVDILNFDICIRDYLYKTNKKGEFKMLMKEMKDKILSKEEYFIKSDEEFYILCGQMAKFLKSKTQTNEKTNRLYYEYLMAHKTQRLIDILERDKARLDYDSKTNGRSNRIMCTILEYYTSHKENLININLTEFYKGLYYGDCVLYLKNENINNMEGK